MRHRKKGRKFGRERDQRRALMRGMAAAFFVAGRIRTSEAKAKELRPYVERLLTRARSSDLADRRRLIAAFNPRLAGRMIARAAEIGARAGGYTRIVKIMPRRSDSSKMALLELLK